MKQLKTGKKLTVVIIGLIFLIAILLPIIPSKKHCIGILAVRGERGGIVCKSQRQSALSFFVSLLNHP